MAKTSLFEWSMIVRRRGMRKHLKAGQVYLILWSSLLVEMVLSRRQSTPTTVDVSHFREPANIHEELVRELPTLDAELHRAEIGPFLFYRFRPSDPFGIRVCRKGHVIPVVFLQYFSRRVERMVRIHKGYMHEAGGLCMVSSEILCSRSRDKH